MSDAFKRLVVSDWRQFAEVDVTFHPRLTILTGANASGKSTLLGILSRHFNWSRSYSSAPGRRSEGSAWASLGPRRRARMLQEGGVWGDIGALTYVNNVETRINVPEVGAEVRQAYDIYMPLQQPVTGLFLNSHRPANGNYTTVPSIPTIFPPSEQLFEQYATERRNQWAGQWTGRTSQLALKETLISAAVFGNRGNDHVSFNADAASIWDGFQKVVAAVLPASLRFRQLRVEVPDIIIETDTGDFVIDDASGGISAIVDVAWQIFLRSRGHASFTAILDEPENHLHPSLQRELLPRLLSAFPGVQFIVATHSPFVVTATPDSAVYALEYNEGNKVESRLLDYSNKAAGADETLKRVLGVPSIMPIWAEERFDEIVNRHLRGSVSTETLLALRAELTNMGLESEFPSAAVQFLDRSSDSDTQ
ncbi:AAA family ATPase [Clavibacter phaseoli]|nr:AAA family ATPase [Clavibacter phaseoli]UKF38032.1 AAA family ATPase [Clavibacter phaseoli]